MVCLIRLCMIWGTATLVGVDLMNLYAQEEQMYRCRWQTRVFLGLMISGPLASNLDVSDILDA